MSSLYTSSSTKPIYYATQIVWYIFGILGTLLVFRFALKLLGADPVSGFASFIYGITNIFAIPFLNVFRVTYTGAGTVFEWTTLLAVFVYWVIAVSIIKFLFMGRTVSTPEAASMLESQEQ